jgi:hypothetical protein
MLGSVERGAAMRQPYCVNAAVVLLFKNAGSVWFVGFYMQRMLCFC